MSEGDQIDRQSDARTRKILNRLLVVLVVVSVIAGLVLRSLEHSDSESERAPTPPVKEAPEKGTFDPIPDPIPDPVEVP